MATVPSPGRTAQRARRQVTNTIKESLRDLRIQLATLNHHVGTRAELRDVDLDCLDLIARRGPLSPTTLAREAGVHPATLTGILDRLERGGWVTRERDPDDRRAVAVGARRDRAGELVRLFAGMNTAMDRICAGYSERELELIAEFLRRTTEAGRTAAEDLAGSG
jgi:DNA-binding MarR family transcriptional regulator